MVICGGFDTAMAVRIKDCVGKLADFGTGRPNRGGSILPGHVGSSCRSIAAITRGSVGSIAEANAAASVPSRPTRYL